MKQRTRIRKSRHGHWMTYHRTGYTAAHQTWEAARDDAVRELRRYDTARQQVWRKVDPVIKVRTLTNGQRTRQRIAERDGAHCHYCKTGLHPLATEVSPRRGTVDHVVPRALGGPSRMDNYVLACSGCNVRKGHQRGDCRCIFCAAAWYIYYDTRTP